jgi:hypothetical protein
MARYKVVGTQPVFDHAPGEEFEHDIPAEQERLLIESGALEKDPASAPEAPAEPAPEVIQGP